MHTPEKAQANKGTETARASRLPAMTPAAAARQPMTPAAVLTLQRAIGNQAVSRALAQEQHIHSAGCGHGAVQRRATFETTEATSETPEAPADILKAALASEGRQIEGRTLKRAQSFYQNDRLSEGRVHTGPLAQRAVEAFGAKALTVGRDILFGTGVENDTTTAFHEIGHLDKNIKGIRETGTADAYGIPVTNQHQHSEREAANDGAAAAAGAEVAPSVAQRAVQQNAAPAARSDAEIQRASSGDAFASGAEFAPSLTAQRAVTVQRGVVSGTSLPQAAARAESGGGLVGGAVQRRLSIRNAQNPQKTRELSSEKSVREFLEQHNISILESVETRMGASLGAWPAGRVEFRASIVIQDFIADEKPFVYDDSKAGAQELADVICAQVIKSLAKAHGKSAASTPSAMPGQMNPRHLGGGNPGTSPGGPRYGVLEHVLSQLARQKMGENTPKDPFVTGLGHGVQSAVTGRATVLTEPLPSSQSVSEGMRWAAWVALEGEDKVRREVQRAAEGLGPEEGQRLLAQFGETLEAKKQEMAGTVVGSAATGAAIGQVANVIPHPGLRVAAKVSSMILGSLATAKKVGDGADAVKQIGEVSPQTYKKLLDVRNQALGQAANAYMERSRENTMEQMRDFNNFG